MNHIIALVFTLMMFYTSLAQQQPAVCLRWKIAGQLPAQEGQQQASGIAGPVAGVSNNVLIVGGGSNFPDAAPWQGGKKKYYDELYVFRKVKDSLVHSGILFHLPFALAYTANCATPQGIVCAGGENEKGISNKVLVLQWNKAAKNISIQYLPDLPVALTNASLVYYNKKVFLAGGETADKASAHFYCLDMNNIAAGWQALPPLLQPVSHAVLAVITNDKGTCLYLCGGRMKTDNGISKLYVAVDCFDIATNKWVEKQSLPYALSAGTGISWKNNIVLLGGDKGETFHKTEQLIAAINKEKDTARKAAFIQQKAALQAAHPGFSKEILLYHADSDEWTKAGAVPFTVPVTTTAVQWGDDVIIPGGEIRAGVRTPQILLAHLSLKE